MQRFSTLMASVGAFLVLGTALATAQEARSPSPQELEQAFERVAEEVLPATVGVQVVDDSGQGVGFGSGVIISPDGWILTCAHVLEGGSHYQVLRPNQSPLVGRVVGHNEAQDYALLKVEAARDLPYVELGDSDRVKPGDWVVALGHPGGRYPDGQPSLSVGRITALHLQLPHLQGRYYDDVFETDVPIFAGSSGGPLVDLEGRLVGLNGAILLANDSAYAIPVAEITKHLPLLKQGLVLTGRKPPTND